LLHGLVFSQVLTSKLLENHQQAWYQGYNPWRGTLFIFFREKTKKLLQSLNIHLLIAARQRKSSDSGVNHSNVTSPERMGRTRTRIAGVSQSQRKPYKGLNYENFTCFQIAATSRSGSPSSRLSYATYRDNGAMIDQAPISMGSISRPRRLGGGIPRSQGASREGSRDPSPNRYGSLTYSSKLRYCSVALSNSVKLKQSHLIEQDLLLVTVRPIPDRGL
jgi:hypothetical protein